MYLRHRLIAGATCLALSVTGLAVGGGGPAQGTARQQPAQATARQQPAQATARQQPAQATAQQQPAPGHTSLVPTSPRNDLPEIHNGEVFDIETIGSDVYIAGTFSSIVDANGTEIPQRFLASYNLDTRRVNTDFAPTLDGYVANIEAAVDGSGLFIVGQFNTISGVTKRKIAKIDPDTGEAIRGFTAQADGRGQSLEVTADAVYVGGQFTRVNESSRSALAALNPDTGAVDTSFDLPVTGGIGVGGILNVMELLLTHDNSTLIVIHTGRAIAGQDRYGVGMIDLATNTVTPWRTALWEENLSFVGGIQRVYTGDIAPDDSYFVVSSGSGGDRPPINDTIIAFPVAGGGNVEPTWISRGFDSVYAVAITEVAVYIGGHFRFLESPTSNQPWPGQATVGYGNGQALGAYTLRDQVVRREHLGALDPTTGTALEWFSISTSYEGEKAMLATDRGLFIGGDGSTKGDRSVGRVGFYDLSQLPRSSPIDTDIVSPYEGTVQQSDETFTVTGTATAPDGVDAVEIEVQRRTTGQYLQADMTTFGDRYTFTATLAAQGEATVDWSIDLSAPLGEYNLVARAVSGGDSDPSPADDFMETFNFDDMPPTTTIEEPSGDILASPTFTLTGTATDDKGVERIILTFRQRNQYLQADGTLAATYNAFAVDPAEPGALETTWTYDVVLPGEGEWIVTATAMDNSGQSDQRGDQETYLVDADAAPPTITITSPVEMIPPQEVGTVVVTPGERITFAGVASDDEAITGVDVYLRNSTTREALAVDGSWAVDNSAGYYRITPQNLREPTYEWSWTSPELSAGRYSFRVRTRDSLGLETGYSESGRLDILAQLPGDNFPNTRLDFTGTSQEVDTLHLDITGSASDDQGVESVRVALRDLDTGRYLQPNGQSGAGFATLNAVLEDPGAARTGFTLSVDLPHAGEWQVEAWAFDTAGQQDASIFSSTARYLIYPNDDPPTLTATLFLPEPDQVFTDGKIVISGRAEDDFSTDRVEIQIANRFGQGMTSSGEFRPGGGSWIPAFLTSPGSPGSNFAYTTPSIPAGVYTITARAVDANGQIGPSITRSVTVEVPPPPEVPDPPEEPDVPDEPDQPEDPDVPDDPDGP